MPTAEVFHVIEYIEDECAARGWTLDDLAARMGGDFDQARLGLDLLATEYPGLTIGEEGAEQLARAFGTSAEVWANIDRTWQKWKAEQQ